MGDALVPLADDGAEHDVLVVLGQGPPLLPVLAEPNE